LHNLHHRLAAIFGGVLTAAIKLKGACAAFNPRAGQVWTRLDKARNALQF
jgi:hypothetical protein